MTIHTDSPELRATVATACRILAHRRLVDGLLGHVSARVSDHEIVIRCRGAGERGLAASTPGDVWRMTLEGDPVDLPPGFAPPKEWPLHTELYRARTSLGAVVHAHPPSALLCGLAGLTPRPVFGAFNIPAMRVALEGVPVYPRSVLITRRELALEMIERMEAKSTCLLYGHGITVTGASVEEATVRAVNLDQLLDVTVRLAMLGATPPEVPARDLQELPDLGSAFNERLAWQALVAASTAPTHDGPQELATGEPA